jgi:hypothetical protein
MALRDTSLPTTRLEALRTRHSRIEIELEQKRRHLSVSDLSLRDLKKMKLALKEEMEGINATS